MRGCLADYRKQRQIEKAQSFNLEASGQRTGGHCCLRQGAGISTLIHLLPGKAKRQEAFEIANSIATADLHVDEQKQELLDTIRKVLKL